MFMNAEGTEGIIKTDDSYKQIYVSLKSGAEDLAAVIRFSVKKVWAGIFK